MRYKFMVNGVAYKVRYANGSYLPDISKSGYAYLAVYYDNNLMATGEQSAVRDVNNVSVTFDGGTYNVSFTSSTKRRSFSAEVTPADKYAYIDVSDCATGTWTYTITTNSASKEGSFSIPLPNAKKQELILGEFGGVATLIYKVSSGGTSNLTSLQHSSSDPTTTITAQIM